MAVYYQEGQQGGIFQHDNTRPPSETQVFPLLSLKGKTAIVTGGGDGFGLAIAEAFAEAGANVALWYNNNKSAVDKAANISATYNRIEGKAYQVEVTDEEAVNTAVDNSVKDLGGVLDVFVANAGISWYTGNIIDSDTDTFKNILDVNLLSVYYAAKAAGKYFRRQKLDASDKELDNKKAARYSHGSFIITSSIAATRQLMPQYLTPYGISKAALNQFTRCLAGEWVQFARVNSVSAGYVLTKLTEPATEIMFEAWKGRVPMGQCWGN
ncbi:hypothetical protein Dda_2004 [Drechslerella dactyloides]|uniref:Uncharacterized protein n=1 Tax=Drechslerella dactyloides TaxID=74499 RepID=A0AAD6NL39_DREDA|nr:hypothetical protein Dda_2004 [Drechslerella dactyloides]